MLSPIQATGSTTPRSLADRAADVVNVKDFGAKGDDATDDTAALNAAFAHLRSSRSIGGVAVWHIVFPQGNYKITGTINATGLQSKATFIEGSGANIDCQVSGAACIDAMHSRWLRMRDLTITGSSTSTPTIGMQIGRTDTTSRDSEDNHSFENLFFTGKFMLAAFYNNSAETTKFDHVLFWNNSASGYSLIQDGLNHFNVPTLYAGGQKQPVDSPQSFNENLFLNCDFRNGSGGSAIWMGFTARHKFVRSYIGNTGGTGFSPAIVLYALGDNSPASMLDLDIHTETSTVSDMLYVTGTATNVAIPELTIRDHQSFVNNAVIKLDPSIRGGGTITDLALAIGGFAGGATKIFNDATKWTVSGRYSLPSSAVAYWNAASFSGTATVGTSTTFSGKGTFSALGAGLAQDANRVLSLSLPKPLPVASIASSGGVSGITLISPTGCYGGKSTGTEPFPKVAIVGPPAGGTQAMASVTTMTVYSAPLSTFVPGSGYQVNDLLTMVGGTGTPLQIRVSSVDGGGAITGDNISNVGSYTALPPAAGMFTGGHGTGAAWPNIGWKVGSVTVMAAGSGYGSAPGVTFPAGDSPYCSTAPQGARAQLNNTLTASGGGYQSVLLDGAGAKIGVAGENGVPLLSQGALIDNSGVRHSLGSSYTVPANTSLVRLTQAGTVNSSTITLPAALADGQPIQFVNYGGAVTALTFSPTVNGWTNGATLTAYTGLRIRWDATAGAWYREQ